MSQGDVGKSGASASSFETLQEKSSDEVLKRLRDIRDLVRNVQDYVKNFEMHMDKEFHIILESLRSSIVQAQDSITNLQVHCAEVQARREEIAFEMKTALEHGEDLTSACIKAVDKLDEESIARTADTNQKIQELKEEMSMQHNAHSDQVAELKASLAASADREEKMLHMLKTFIENQQTQQTPQPLPTDLDMSNNNLSPPPIPRPPSPSMMPPVRQPTPVRTTPSRPPSPFTRHGNLSQAALSHQIFSEAQAQDVLTSHDRIPAVEYFEVMVDPSLPAGTRVPIQVPQGYSAEGQVVEVEVPRDHDGRISVPVPTAAHNSNINYI